MNRKIIALDLMLVALAVVLGWQIRSRWAEERARERAVFTTAARRMAVLPPPPLIAPKPVTAVEYLDVAQKMLFSKDRNPNVVIEPPAPKPKPPLPALPEYYGQMHIADPVVVLALGGAQKSYRAGEKVGPFEIASFTSRTITFVWNGENVERNLDDLRPKEGTPPQAAAASRPAVGAAAAPAVHALSAPESKADDKNPLGVDMGSGYAACKADDKSPNGTVANGYKKVVIHGLMGDSCHWEVVK
ncbi:MAG TPA: hypothetical protein VMG40_08035 [Bryobacteraceae bacterium]|nr:hypothetical protein [Bryobacteraceae bacterium]